MGMFSSNGRLEVTHDRGLPVVGEAIKQVVQQNGHHLGTISPDGSRYELATTRTAFNWGTAIVLTLTPVGPASTHVVVDYDNVPGSPSALMDGRKNTKTVNKFMESLASFL